MLRTLFLILLSVPLFISCDKDKDKPSVVLPTNISTEISTNFGEVTVTVSADNTNFYKVLFYENGTPTTEVSNDGVANYTFASSGTYTIVSQAHSSETSYISKTETIEITVTPATSGAPTTGYESPISYPNYSLVWQDEFNGTSLSSDWVFDIGGNGWGNNELQYYNNQNINLAGGILEITAKEEAFNASNYTSTRIKTQGKKSWKYGRIDVRAALPEGKGIWPALWMLGDNISTVGWPSCGEIDIMELIGGAGFNDRTVYGTIHWNELGTHAQYGGDKTLASGKFSDEFHVFSIIWNQTSITWLVDNAVFHTVDITDPEKSELHENFFLIFNVAVGGNFPGNPDASSVFPQSMYVDYVRVFQ
jgi:beta-glucanase (GH16 family)